MGRRASAAAAPEPVTADAWGHLTIAVLILAVAIALLIDRR
jgi:hypothetical protein